jgi:hypothetical protein
MLLAATFALMGTVGNAAGYAAIAGEFQSERHL